MQNTLPLSVGHPLRNTVGLARQIALPGEHAPLRFPSFPALERTAVMGFNQPTTVVLPASTPIAFSVFRQAVYPVWADINDPYFAVVDVALTNNPTAVGGGTGVTSSTTLIARPNIMTWGVANRFVNPSYPAVTGAPAATFAYPILGRDVAESGSDFLYCPPNGLIGAALYMKSGTPSTAVVDFSVELEFWVSPGSTFSTSTSGSIAANLRGGGFFILADAKTCWFRVRSVNLDNRNTGALDATSFGISLIATTAGSTSYTSNSSDTGVINYSAPGGPVRRHLPIVVAKEFSNSTLPWRAARVTASAFLGTNVSQVLNKGGTVLGGRLSPSLVNAWAATNSDLTNLHPAEKAYLPLETGVYTYCPPSTDLVFFHDYTANVSIDYVGYAAPVFRLDNDSLYNKMFVTPAGAEESMACTVSWHIEFRTSSALFQIGLSGMTLEALHAAQLSLAEAGFFFENPEHDSVLNKVIASAKKFAPIVAGAINPTAGKLLSSIISKSTVHPKPGPSRAPGTSGKASGIVDNRTPKGKKGPKPKAKAAPQPRQGKRKP